MLDTLVQSIALPLLLFLALYGISWGLLKKKLFRPHLVYLVLLAAAAVAATVQLDCTYPLNGSSLIFLLLFCVWDHYWAKRNLGMETASLEQARKAQKVLAVILTVCTVLAYLDVAFFSWFQDEVVLSAAVLLWANAYFQKDNTEGRGTPFGPK